MALQRADCPCEEQKGNSLHRIYHIAALRTIFSHWRKKTRLHFIAIRSGVILVLEVGSMISLDHRLETTSEESLPPKEGRDALQEFYSSKLQESC